MMKVFFLDLLDDKYCDMNRKKITGHPIQTFLHNAIVIPGMVGLGSGVAIDKWFVVFNSYLYIYKI